jgi:aryl-alcohol dehydrogenase-like predicted oxidoreductase
MTKLGSSDLDVFPLALGGNVFGWTADEVESFAVLDAYTAAGGNFIDTADGYSAWVPGHSGGESEVIIGKWLKARGNRDQVIIATKVATLPPNEGLSAKSIAGGVEDSLRRLGIDHIDLYYSHFDDPETPVEETVTAHDALVKAGKVRYVGASNFSPERLQASLGFAKQEGLAGYVALQPHYNLVERDKYEGALADVVAANGLSSVPYFGLAKGFLTGKYREGVTVDSPRAAGAAEYANAKGWAVLSVLDELAATHDTTVAAVSLAWLAAQPTIAAPIASARNVAQLADLLPVATLQLSEAELAALTKVSA